MVEKKTIDIMIKFNFIIYFKKYLNPRYDILPKIGPYTYVASKYCPKGSSAARIVFTCL
tara:strand:+ start:312 stop:488 length:177 start_codon:yes stop_codon:yes gene_type:complete